MINEWDGYEVPPYIIDSERHYEDIKNRIARIYDEINTLTYDYISSSDLMWLEWYKDAVREYESRNKHNDDQN
jgi:hypothetical protein